MGIVRAVLVDIEGTVLAPMGPIAGAAQALDVIRRRGLALRFVTNVDSRPPHEVLEGLLAQGIMCSADELFTPVLAARRLLLSQAAPRVRLLVSPATAPSFEEFLAPDRHTHVVVGDCGGVLDYGALDGAFRALEAGAELVALQRGRYYQRADGHHVDAGALVVALEFAAGVQARLMGKPSPEFFGLALDSLGVAAVDAVMVGDDAVSDIAGAAAVGLAAIQVRTGKYSSDSAEARAVIDSIADLPAVL